MSYLRQEMFRKSLIFGQSDELHTVLVNFLYLVSLRPLHRQHYCNFLAIKWEGGEPRANSTLFYYLIFHLKYTRFGNYPNGTGKYQFLFNCSVNKRKGRKTWYFSTIFTFYSLHLFLYCLLM